ncbi:GPP34 family phosphoprotein [Kitasatospora sp. NPDC088346]|uniref:GOLPH3/VPS74 family protein n=1 Tax=Kitasatospora sp. NPDC088346 TaxID=3364073 RepID=UPI003800E0DE
MTTTPQDLLLVALDAESGRPPEQGELSLALAGAELIDLLGAGAVRLDGDVIVPDLRPTIADDLLDRAAAELVRQPPYESVEDWLWRRGRGLAAAYRATLEPEGRTGRPHRRRRPSGAAGPVPEESPDRRAATDRLAAREPVLTGLAAAAGIGPARSEDEPDVTDDTVATVLATVHDAVRELDAVRRRRAVEDAAFDNIWRGGGL